MNDIDHGTRVSTPRIVAWRERARNAGATAARHTCWLQLGGALLAMIMIANLQYAWTIFVQPIHDGTGWALSDIQWAATLFVLCQTWAQPVQGWLVDRVGPRVFISIAGVLCALGWGGLGVVSRLPALYAAYSVAGVGAGLVYGGSVGLALKWFRDRRGLAAGILTAGFGGGAALFIPFISWMIATRGYRAAFVWTGVIHGAIILVVAQFLRHPPADSRTFAPCSPATSSRLGRDQFTTAEMVRHPRFYVVYIMFVMIATGGLLVTLNAGAIAHDWGISATALTLAASLNAGASGTSRVFWGWISDRIGRETAMSVAFFFNAASLLLVLTIGHASGALFVATLLLTFLTWGGTFSLFPSLIADYFGTRHATSNYGVLYSAKGVASIVSGGLVAVLYERFVGWSAILCGSAMLALAAAAVALYLTAARDVRSIESAAYSRT
jgi:MFS transporter, OFA family, oxalate/formate antiporter